MFFLAMKQQNDEVKSSDQIMCMGTQARTNTHTQNASRYIYIHSQKPVFLRSVKNQFERWTQRRTNLTVKIRLHVYAITRIHNIHAISEISIQHMAQHNTRIHRCSYDIIIAERVKYSFVHKFEVISVFRRDRTCFCTAEKFAGTPRSGRKKRQ